MIENLYELQRSISIINNCGENDNLRALADFIVDMLTSIKFERNGVIKFKQFKIPDNKFIVDVFQEIGSRAAEAYSTDSLKEKFGLEL